MCVWLNHFGEGLSYSLVTVPGLAQGRNASSVTHALGDSYNQVTYCQKVLYYTS